ncbi:uncharacterized protein [Manis javanica]|uniref:uncharacterized protein isoform X2 n=1 Tax=Manis javanica TaxID=9974 RepID=UPI003C6D78CB
MGAAQAGLPRTPGPSRRRATTAVLPQVYKRGAGRGTLTRHGEGTVHYRRLDCQTHARLGKDVSALRNLLFQQIAFQDKPDAMP